MTRAKKNRISVTVVFAYSLDIVFGLRAVLVDSRNVVSEVYCRPGWHSFYGRSWAVVSSARGLGVFGRYFVCDYLFRIFPYDAVVVFVPTACMEDEVRAYRPADEAGCCGGGVCSNASVGRAVVFSY